MSHTVSTTRWSEMRVQSTVSVHAVQDAALLRLQECTLELAERVERESESHAVSELARVSLALGTRAMLRILKSERESYTRANYWDMSAARNGASQCENGRAVVVSGGAL